MSNNIPNSSNKIYVSKLQSEHVKIVSFLKKNDQFENFINKHKEFQVKGDPRSKFTEHLKEEFKSLFHTLSDHYGKSISELKNSKILTKHISTLSGRLKVFNVLLEEFCQQSSKAIDPPIQIFTSHNFGDDYKDGIHFACAEKVKGANNKRYSQNNVRFDDAKKQKSLDTQSALELAERTYFRYRTLSCPLLTSSEVVTHLEQRHSCKALTIGSSRLPVTVLWKNTDKLIHPNAILGDFDDTLPQPFQSSPILNKSKYSKAREFIKQKYEAHPSKMRYEGCNYLMTSIDLSQAVPKVNGAFGLYYDNILTQYAIEWELKKALLHESKKPIANLLESQSLPLREAVEKDRNPLIDGGGRCAAITISTLIVFRRSSGDLYTILARRSQSVGVSPGLHHVAPAGMFEAPNTDDTWSIEENIWRELLEEIYNEEEQIGQGDAEIKDYIYSLTPIKLLRNMIRNAGGAELSVTGICCDLLNLRPEITTILYIPSEEFVEAGRMALNWEYEKQGPRGSFGVKWDRIEEVANELVASNNIVVSGAACLSLGREWLSTRHGV